ncbi:MAG: hypothetical protein EXR86_01315 [Gammaproteobacteria bacterium]|nr:hypothetical protein [Gammaproteobacteria bacterium]
MSHQAFVDFYTKYLDSAAGEQSRAKLEGIKDHTLFCAKMVELGNAAGFKFIADEVKSVMEASEAKAAKALAKASGELSEDQLEGVVGGAGRATSIPLVNIRPVVGGLKVDPGKVGSTVMCPW